MANSSWYQSGEITGNSLLPGSSPHSLSVDTVTAQQVRLTQAKVGHRGRVISLGATDDGFKENLVGL